MKVLTLIFLSVICTTVIVSAHDYLPGDRTEDQFIKLVGKEVKPYKNWFGEGKKTILRFVCKCKLAIGYRIRITVLDSDGHPNSTAYLKIGATDCDNKGDVFSVPAIVGPEKPYILDFPESHEGRAATVSK